MEENIEVDGEVDDVVGEDSRARAGHPGWRRRQTGAAMQAFETTKIGRILLIVVARLNDAAALSTTGVQSAGIGHRGMHSMADSFRHMIRNKNSDGSLFFSLGHV
mmetsp:Transcript_12307/g.28050  ORF Transcript_12307/g.28050 Transcript_12307/m.28050 type:complete len:105 (+) Transcript_12307:2486-2800(+)